MRRLLLILFGFLLLSADVVDYSLYQKDDTNARIKAAFLYNFTRFFEWPNNSNANFTIAIYGDNPSLLSELNKMAATKMVASQKLEIKVIKDIKDIESPNILYILPDKSHALADALVKLKGKGTLVITEKHGLAKVGAAINFIVEQNKQEFELNKASAIKAGLKVSSSLETKAFRIVN